ncbi:hypothetical protein [Thiothrix unzii]|jgi:hypothetical protein|uniref:hypothetical protein n=1 Tax=Thiothrix unzii TaxID=111769 RepID=UPI002A35F265|nr:hypothetical protein [Thiothrix unzii]MDX9988721.1 hypothetical protein [Thiothrix unzii]
MKSSLTEITIKIVLLNGLFVSFIILQDIMNWNIFPTSIETFVHAMFLSFEAFIFTMYIASILLELKEIGLSLKKISHHYGDGDD